MMLNTLSVLALIAVVLAFWFFAWFWFWGRFIHPWYQRKAYEAVERFVEKERYEHQEEVDTGDWR